MNKSDSNSKMNSITAVKSTDNNKVKIALPTLCAYGDSDDEEEEEIITNPKLKNIAPSNSNSAPSVTLPPSSNPNATMKKSGLLSILPPPKSHAFLKKDNNSINNTNSIKQATTQPTLLPRTLKSSTKSGNSNILNSVQIEKTTKNLLMENNSDSDHDDELNHKKFKSEPVSTSDSFKLKSTISYKEYNYEPDPEIKFGDEQDEKEDVREDDLKSNYTNYNQTITPASTSSTAASSNLVDQEAWLKLCGGKRKKIEPIEFLDVSASAIIGDNRSELMKQITEEYKPSANKDYFVGGGKKKSQITYLAYVAKERDQELKAMWAQQKHNKQQSRQKYGF